MEQNVYMTVTRQFISRVQDVGVSAQRHVFDGQMKHLGRLNIAGMMSLSMRMMRMRADMDRLTEARRAATSTHGGSRGSEMFARKQGGTLERGALFKGMQEAEKTAARKETWQTPRWMFTRGSASGNKPSYTWLRWRR